MLSLSQQSQTVVSSIQNCNFAITEWATMNSSDFLISMVTLRDSPAQGQQALTHNQPCAHGEKKPSSRTESNYPCKFIISSSKGEENRITNSMFDTQRKRQQFFKIFKKCVWCKCHASIYI